MSEDYFEHILKLVMDELNRLYKKLSERELMIIRQTIQIALGISSGKISDWKILFEKKEARE